MTETSSLTNKVKLTCIDPEFEQLLLRACDSNAMFRIMAVHSNDLLYRTPATGC